MIFQAMISYKSVSQIGFIPQNTKAKHLRFYLYARFFHFSFPTNISFIPSKDVYFTIKPTEDGPP